MLNIIVEVGADKKTTTFGFTEAIEHVTENFGIRDQDLTVGTINAFVMSPKINKYSSLLIVLFW